MSIESCRRQRGKRRKTKGRKQKRLNIPHKVVIGGDGDRNKIESPGMGRGRGGGLKENKKELKIPHSIKCGRWVGMETEIR